MDPSTPRPGSPGAPLWDPDAIPAATVVVLRDSVTGVEVLMLHRDRDLSFAGGMWVFPGGRVDPGDHHGAVDDLRMTTATISGDDATLEAAARAAAVREAHEEAGLRIDAAELTRWSHWTPPPESPKRFSTAFYVAPLPPGAQRVVIDDSEIRDHRWLMPATVLGLRAEGEIGLSPPTFITLTQLCEHRTVRDVVDHARSMPGPEHFATRVQLSDEAIVALYHGDVDYEGAGSGEPTGRHRLTMGDNWIYERDT